MRTRFLFATALFSSLIIVIESRAQNGWKVDTVKRSVIGVISGVDFTSANEGVIVGDTCLKTTDGGKTWLPLAPAIGWNAQRQSFSAIHCFSNLEWVGVNTSSFRTTDAGQSWIFDSLHTLFAYSSYFTAVEFVGGAGLAVGTNNAVSFSNDRGASWSTVSSIYGPYALNYFGVAAAGSAWIVVGGNPNLQTGVIIRSSIAGWDTVLRVSSRVVTAVSFANANLGYAAADSIYRTSDGGVTWKGVSQSPASVRGMSFKHPSVGTLVGSLGKIYRTLDSGAHWTPQTSNTQMDLWAVCFIDTSRGWAVGYRDIVVRTTNGGWGTLVSVGKPTAWIPDAYSLSLNYPNPFNPSTTIRYDLPKAANVSLRIYNTLGQVVATLVDGRKEAGYYQVTWNANVPSGIYFYRLQAGNFVETKKMILLR